MTYTNKTRPPPKALFMFPLELDLKPKALRDVKTAYEFSKHGHAKQVRDDGRRYFDHPKSAAWTYIDEYGGRSRRLIIGLLLHDMLEDSFLLSPYNISHNFGKNIAGDMRAVTKLPKGKETTEEYLMRVIEQGPYAIAEKLFDRLDNVRDLAGVAEKKRQEQIAETKQYHLRLLVPALAAHGGKWKQMASWLETRITEAISAY
jgi:(p)ppGpp synthase/HD superfamily hydrolase